MLPKTRTLTTLGPSILRRSLSSTLRRSLSSTLPRAATAHTTPPKDPRGGSPVEDIDVVFDYPSEAQGSMSKSRPSLEASGLGPGVYGGKYTGKGIDDTLDSMKGSMGEMKDKVVGEAMSGMSGAGRMAGKAFKEPAKRIDKEMGSPDNNVIYAGLGALGLGALYMKLRDPGKSGDPTVDARRNMVDAKHDFPAHAPLESKVEKFIGRSA